MRVLALHGAVLYDSQFYLLHDLVEALHDLALVGAVHLDLEPRLLLDQLDEVLEIAVADYYLPLLSHLPHEFEKAAFGFFEFYIVHDIGSHGQRVLVVLHIFEVKAPV